MDPLTQRLLERTRARREDLAKKMAENKVETQKRKAPLVPNSTLNSREHENNTGLHVVQKQVSEVTSVSPKTSMKNRFNILATQRTQWDVQREGKDVDSSPVLPKLQSRQVREPTESQPSSQPVPASRKSRFAALAANINAWEDDTCHPKAAVREEERPVKKWQRPAAPEQEEPIRTQSKREVTNNPIKPRSPIKHSVHQRNSSATNPGPPRPVMSRSARYQLGSSRLGDENFHTATTKDVLLPQPKKCSAVDEKSPAKSEPKAAPRTPASLAPSQTKRVEEKGPSPKKRPSQELSDSGSLKKKQATSTTFAMTRTTESETRAAPNYSNAGSLTTVEPRVGAMAKSIQDRLKSHQSNWQSNEISQKIQKDRMKDMAVLKSRWAKTGGQVRFQEPESESEDDTMEDSTEEGEAYMETDIDNVTEPVEESAKSESAPVETLETSIDEEEEEAEDADDEDESDVNLTDVLGDIDELIVEAEKAMKEEQEKAKLTAPESTPQVEVCSSKPPPSEPERPVQTERRPTVQQPTPKPVQRIVRDEQVKREQQQNRAQSRAKQQSINAEKIQALMAEVSAQQSIINQTSQALSLIASNETLRNTVEEIEAEKMMVISNQKRQACLTEIQYLKNATRPGPEYTEDGAEITSSKGHVLIKDIRLPFKTEYIMDLESNKEIPSHYYFIISRCGALVTCTNMLNTRENLTGDCLKFTTEIAINDLDSNFSIELLVYQMRSTVTRVEGMAERAMSQHSVPNKQSRFGSLTPKKLLSSKNSSKHHSSRSSHQSQSGSRPVRSSTFGLVGSGRLSLASCGTTKFMLSRVPLTSPLEGGVHLCMSCRKNSNIVMKGFLTMFDEISGFGSWHRRWCVLAEGYVTFWKYPDEERRKPPIGSIDLRECITREVAQISRILCARPNTFELSTQMPATRYQKETLISTCNNSVLTTKNMISADVKEERIEWIDALNRTLEDLRMWNKDAATPTQ